MYTKGEWRVEHCICGDKGCQDYYVNAGGVIIDQHLDKATAQLIAATPELLEACKGALLAVNDALNNKSTQGLNLQLAPKYLTQAIQKAEATT